MSTGTIQTGYISGVGAVMSPASRTTSCAVCSAEDDDRAAAHRESVTRELADLRRFLDEHMSARQPGLQIKTEAQWWPKNFLSRPEPTHGTSRLIAATDRLGSPGRKSHRATYGRPGYSLGTLEATIESSSGRDGNTSTTTMPVMLAIDLERSITVLDRGGFTFEWHPSIKFGSANYFPLYQLLNNAPRSLSNFCDPDSWGYGAWPPAFDHVGFVHAAKQAFMDSSR